MVWEGPLHVGIPVIRGDRTNLGLAFGFPCTDTSNAGRQAGLGGTHSSLVFEALRVSDELKVAWMFIENVEGITSRGDDKRLIEEVISLRSFGFLISL